TFQISHHNLSLPICLFLNVYQNRVRVIYLVSTIREGESIIRNGVLDFISSLDFKKFIFEYVALQARELCLNIWVQQKTRIKSKGGNSFEFGSQSSKLQVDQLINSIIWVFAQIKERNSSKDGYQNLDIIEIEISRELRINTGQMKNLEENLNSICDLGGRSEMRIFAFPNSNNLTLLLLQPLSRKELIGIIFCDPEMGSQKYHLTDLGTQTDRTEQKSQFHMNTLAICFLLHLTDQPNSIGIGGFETLKIQEKKTQASKAEALRLEVENTLKAIHDFFKRTRMIQRIQVYGSDLSGRYIEDLVENQFSINILLDSELIRQLPTIKIQIPSKKTGKEMPQNVIKIREGVGLIISFFRKFWTENKVVRFSTSLYCTKGSEAEEDKDFVFSQSRLFSILIKERNELILVRIYTTFNITPKNTIKWTFNKVIFTFRNVEKVRFFLLNEGEEVKEANLHSEGQRHEIIDKIFRELITRSIKFVLDYCR
ncbi:hypothetical protein HWI79_2723, partial [Cryptosporidium felis]